MIHVAIIHKRYLEAILAGTKTIEARIAKNRCVPFGRIHKGERIYFKQSSGPFRATAIAHRIQTFENLTPVQLNAIRLEHSEALTAEPEYWKTKKNATCATLVWLKDVEPLNVGPDLTKFQPKGSRRAWFVLPSHHDVYPSAHTHARAASLVRHSRPSVS